MVISENWISSSHNGNYWNIILKNIDPLQKSFHHHSRNNQELLSALEISPFQFVSFNLYPRSSNLPTYSVRQPCHFKHAATLPSVLITRPLGRGPSEPYHASLPRYLPLQVGCSSRQGIVGRKYAWLASAPCSCFPWHMTGWDESLGVSSMGKLGGTARAYLMRCCGKEVTGLLGFSFLNPFTGLSWVTLACIFLSWLVESWARNSGAWKSQLGWVWPVGFRECGMSFAVKERDYGLFKLWWS